MIMGAADLLTCQGPTRCEGESRRILVLRELQPLFVIGLLELHRQKVL